MEIAFFGFSKVVSWFRADAGNESAWKTDAL